LRRRGRLCQTGRLRCERRERRARQRQLAFEAAAAEAAAAAAKVQALQRELDKAKAEAAAAATREKCCSVTASVYTRPKQPLEVAFGWLLDGMPP
jgi:hypothetical protein